MKNVVYIKNLNKINKDKEMYALSNNEKYMDTKMI